MKSYHGKITNKAAQEVKAVFPQRKGADPLVKTGTDLRCHTHKTM